MYIANDTGLIYLDISDGSDGNGRICLSGECAESLRKIVYNSIEEENPGAIKSIEIIDFDTVSALIGTVQELVNQAVD